MIITSEGDTMPIRVHTIAVVLGAFAIALVTAAMLAEAASASRHLVVGMVVGGAVTATFAGMLAASDVARAHRK